MCLTVMTLWWTLISYIYMYSGCIYLKYIVNILLDINKAFFWGKTQKYLLGAVFSLFEHAFIRKSLKEQFELQTRLSQTHKFFELKKKDTKHRKWGLNEKNLEIVWRIFNTMSNIQYYILQSLAWLCYCEREPHSLILLRYNPKPINGQK